MMTVGSLNHVPLPRMRFKIDVLTVPAMMIVSVAYVLTSYALTAARMQIVLKALRSLVSSSVRRMSVKNVQSTNIARLDTAVLAITAWNVQRTSNAEAVHA